MEKEFNEIMKELKSRNIKYAKRVFGEFEPAFCKEIQFITIDALNKDDVPNRIQMNSIFITFEIDLALKKVEVHCCGHVYLSEADKKTERYKYLCMKSMESVLKDNGGKAFRKCKYKDAKNLCDKMQNYFELIMENVNEYTGGYPYSKGK